jgi:hypothetical protein
MGNGIVGQRISCKMKKLQANRAAVNTGGQLA